MRRLHRVSSPAREAVLRSLRLALGTLVVCTLLSAGHSYLQYDPHGSGTATGSGPTPVSGEAARQNASTGPAVVTGLRRITDPVVVTTIDAAGPGQVVAFDADGSIVYRNESLGIYHDIGPSPVGRYTVTYVGSDHADSDRCGADSCLLNVIERVNLTTGDVTRLHEWVDARNGSTQTHDVDRVNESVFLVADIGFPDRVYMVDVTTDEEIWEWRVSRAFSPESGGAYPSDWTHVNDVEYLDDGRVMVSLRNQDQVVFVEPGRGIQRNWTLGADGNHDTLFEAHNPDYIPAERGGPAVVVADSENNRLVEYQRVTGNETRNVSQSPDPGAGRWVRTWHWQDVSLQWPRDADRLPSGRTLVVDTHGQRILSVTRSGAIAWSQSVPTGVYDVELLGTGDESTGGPSASHLGLDSRRPTTVIHDGDTSIREASVGPSVGRDGSDATAAKSGTGDDHPATKVLETRISVVVYRIVSLVPPLVLHGLLYVLPVWATPVDAVLVLATSALGTCWFVAELRVRPSPWIRRRRA